VPEQERGTRYDAPWWYLTDAELSAAVAAADGRVAIGFKDPAARGGVDHAGRVVASAAAANAGKTFLRDLGLNVDFEFQLAPAVLLRVPPKLVPLIRANPRIDYIEPLLPGERVAQDTTWNIRRVKAPPAWSQSAGGGQRLLIIDSGIDKFHSDLDVDVIQACDGSNGLPNDAHGTLVAGVAAALNNTIGLIGVAHGVSLWSSKDGDAVPNAGWTACGVEFARVNDVFAINISTSYPTSYTVLADQIAAAWNEGHVIVASVGNNGGSVGYPARYTQVIGVTATDSFDVRPSWASYGTGVELAAPGVSVPTTNLGGGTVIASGTSFAAPHVAAAAALIKAAHPGWSNTRVREALNRTARNLGSSTFYGSGLIDIPAALAYTPPLPPLNVDIGGPTQILPGATCTWWLASTDGTPPFTYQWYNDGGAGGSGTGSFFTTSKQPGKPGNQFTIELRLRDATGREGTDMIVVSEVAGAPECLIAW
jgi:subtilisin